MSNEKITEEDIERLRVAEMASRALWNSYRFQESVSDYECGIIDKQEFEKLSERYAVTPREITVEQFKKEYCILLKVLGVSALEYEDACECLDVFFIGPEKTSGYYEAWLELTLEDKPVE